MPHTHTHTHKYIYRQTDIRTTWLWFQHYDLKFIEFISRQHPKGLTMMAPSGGQEAKATTTVATQNEQQRERERGRVRQ